ncbi:unnamed protein product [Vicia faba]|uniref:Cupin type-1 domain-containing protein n=1 Tax=Vicia faba TaxID=3906 RepID=A0AAV1AE12_VICFA|nr:unnamed protein product [Vicia faba]
MKMICIFIFIFYLLSYTSHAVSTNDFCVADFMFPNTPSGYPCMSETNVTADHFASSTLVAGDTNNFFNLGFTTAFLKDIPGLNGLGISAGRIDFDINGTLPMHIHPDASELIIVAQGLLHYQVNTAPTKAIVYAVYGSENPSIQFLVTLLFRNNLPTPIIEKTTLLDASQIKKLKAQLGGSG